MFSGIVEALGRVEAAEAEGAGRRLALRWPGRDPAEPFVLGESIAVNGCCLTVVAAEGERFEAQAGPETLLRTNLGVLRPGDPVNLERSMRVSDRLGGHFVQGHVDTTAEVAGRRAEGEWEFFRFRLTDPAWAELLVPKGSVAVDGVSLTVVEAGDNGFSVMLIPHTLGVTTLGGREVGDLVNIESDMLAKHVRRLIRRPEPAGPRGV